MSQLSEHLHFTLTNYSRHRQLTQILADWYFFLHETEIFRLDGEQQLGFQDLFAEEE